MQAQGSAGTAVPPPRPGPGAADIAPNGRCLVLLACALVLGLAAGLLETPSVSGAPQQQSARGAEQLYLPLLAEPDGSSCTAQVAVTHDGDGAAHALLLWWGVPTATCGADPCPAPTGVECSGLLSPGGEWTFQAPPARSAAVLGLAPLTLDELGAVPGDDTLVADYLCQVLTADDADCLDLEALLAAHRDGTAWTAPTGVTLPMGQAAGGVLRARVTRECPTDGASLSAAYDGVPAEALPAEDQARGGYLTYGRLVYHTARLGSELYVQSTGPDCTTVELWLREEGACGTTSLCTVRSVAPGTSARLSLADCVPEGWTGTVWLRGAAPLALVATAGGPNFMTMHVGLPGVTPYDVDEDGDIDADDVARVEAALGRQPNDADWAARLDVNANHIVDPADVALVRRNACPTIAAPTAPPTATPTATAIASSTPTASATASTPTAATPTETAQAGPTATATGTAEAGGARIYLPLAQH